MTEPEAPPPEVRREARRGAQPVEIQEFARTVVASASLAEKLAPPRGPFTDDDPGAPVVLTAPGRPEALRIVSGRKARVLEIRGARRKHVL